MLILSQIFSFFNVSNRKKIQIYSFYWVENRKIKSIIIVNE